MTQEEKDFVKSKVHELFSVLEADVDKHIDRALDSGVIKDEDVEEMNYRVAKNFLCAYGCIIESRVFCPARESDKKQIRKIKKIL